MRSSDTLPLNSVPNLLVKPGLPLSLPPRDSCTALSRERGPGQGWALGRLAPVGTGAGCHTVPWRSPSLRPDSASSLSIPTRGGGGEGSPMASHREERQSARSGLRSEGEHLGEGLALEQTRVPVPGCTQHFARGPRLRRPCCEPGTGGRDRWPFFVYCCCKDFVSCFCCFVFGLACLLFKGKEMFVTISSKAPVVCL